MAGRLEKMIDSIDREISRLSVKKRRPDEYVELSNMQIKTEELRRLAEHFREIESQNEQFRS